MAPASCFSWLFSAFSKCKSYCEGEGSYLGLILTAAKILFYPEIPHATRAIALLQLLILLKIVDPCGGVPSLCLSFELMRARTSFGCSSKKALRFLLSPFEHTSSAQLFFNMGAFFYYGQLLEPVYGTVQFSLLIVCLTFLTNIIFLVMMWFLGCAGYACFHSHCVNGFAGVVFALQDIYIHTPNVVNDPINMIDIDMPARYAAFLELLIAFHIIVPGTSMYYCIAGALAGKLFRSFRDRLHRHC